MPLEVREIGIRFSVGDVVPAAAGAEGGDRRDGIGAAEREAIVERCVRDVIDRLRRSGER